MNYHKGCGSIQARCLEGKLAIYYGGKRRLNQKNPGKRGEKGRKKRPVILFWRPLQLRVTGRSPDSIKLKAFGTNNLSHSGGIQKIRGGKDDRKRNEYELWGRKGAAWERRVFYRQGNFILET